MSKSTLVFERAEQGVGLSSANNWGRPVRAKATPQYRAALVETAKMVGAAMQGDPYAMLALKEAFSTSDFPILFGDVLSRELLPAYQAAPSIWTQFARRTTVRDFRPHKFVDLMGGMGLLSNVPELTEYPARDLAEHEYSLTVRKQGARFALSWESLVNDDLGGLQNLPQRLAEGARSSEDYLATSLLIDPDGSGPNSTFFNDTVQDDPEQPNYHPYDNLVDLPLTMDNLADVIQTIQQRRDVDGRPLIISGFVLMVPPSLELAARKILNATEIRFTDPSGETIITNNYIAGSVSLVVNPWLTAIDTSTDAAATWYVLPTPATARPALVVGFLRGHETPDLRVRSSDSRRVGGGDVPAEEGSFDNDDIQYRIRTVTGGTTLDTIATMASTGGVA